MAERQIDSSLQYESPALLTQNGKRLNWASAYSLKTFEEEF
jgi:hypothetical protein